MRISYRIKEDESVVLLKYEGNEWERLDKFYKGLNLKVAETDKGFGRGAKVEFYKTVKGKLMDFIIEKDLQNLRDTSGDIGVYQFQGTYFIFDDINSSAVIKKAYYNIAPFRVVPDKDGLVEIGVSKVLSAQELYNYSTLLAKVYKVINEIGEPVEIVIRFKDTEIARPDVADRRTERTNRLGRL